MIRDVFQESGIRSGLRVAEEIEFSTGSRAGWRRS
jgi:hypothetical protein